MAERFGKYEILQPIAKGGMAEVCLARADFLGGLGRPCAIKRILPAFSSDLQFVSLFIDEARITIGLDHPNVVRLYDFGQNEGTYFMAMEYVDGTDLASLLHGVGRALAPAAAAFIAREVCRGLAHAHELRDHRGQPLFIVHRDVSPQNVLLSAAGEVKLTDFGIAAARNKITHTTPGTVLGKSSYMAPEQALGEPVDARCDIWAVGVLLYEMMTGERLFAAESPVATVARVVAGEVPRPSSRNPEVPPALDEVVRRSVARNPRARYPSAAAMAAALDEALAPLPAFGPEELAALLTGASERGESPGLRPHVVTRRMAATPDATTLPKGSAEDPEVRSLLEQLGREPDLWTLVAIGERHLERGARDAAIATFRAAAAVFASRGLVVQALCAYDPVRPLLGAKEAFDDVVALADLRPGDREELDALIDRFGANRPFRVLCGLDALLEAGPPLSRRVPLLSDLGPRELAALFAEARVVRVPAGSVVVREGDPGDSLFAIGKGRVVVHCTPGARDEDVSPVADLEEDATAVDFLRATAAPRLAAPVGKDRVYLSALGEGDFFGEFSFLTERPRSATIEAIQDAIVLELHRDAVARVAAEDPAFTEPLLAFYKARVVELMMAKSPVFSLLSPDDRRFLLERAALLNTAGDETILEEGAVSDCLYFIKQGEVEVFRRDDKGLSVFLNKLGQGQFFGEISALRGTPRTVSVRAMEPCALFRIAKDDLDVVLSREPKLRAHLEETIASRTAATEARMSEYRRILYST